MSKDAPSWLANDADDLAFVDPMEPPSDLIKSAEVSKSAQLDEEGNIIPPASPKKGSKKISKKSAERTILESSAAPIEQPPPPARDETGLSAAIVMMRMINMAVSIALVTCSVFNLVGLPKSVSVWVLSIYAMCGGLLVCCLETQLKFLRTIIGMNFGFLLNGPLRFLFYFLLASISFSYATLFGYIVAVCLVVVAFYNTYILWRYPTYRSMREKLAAEEDKRIQAKISKETTKQVMRNFRG